MSDNIHEALEDWEFEPGAITVRKIIGEDGQPKVQMRLELGLIQMEMQGRPDGLRPHDRESYLHFHQEKLEEYIKRNGSQDGFMLTALECSELRSESLHYYYRYLSLFHLDEFKQVTADTARNIEVAELLKRFAESDEDKYSIEQYRAYIIMMNTQAQARQSRADGDLYEALGAIRNGIKKIAQFLEETPFDLEDAEDSHEIRLLEELEQEILAELPTDSPERLREELDQAIENEDFEKAASLRDRIRAIEEGDEDE